jgi:hypothetical protein
MMPDQYYQQNVADAPAQADKIPTVRNSKATQIAGYDGDGDLLALWAMNYWE